MKLLMIMAYCVKRTIGSMSFTSSQVRACDIADKTMLIFGYLLGLVSTDQFLTSHCSPFTHLKFHFLSWRDFIGKDYIVYSSASGFCPLFNKFYLDFSFYSFPLLSLHLFLPVSPHKHHGGPMDAGTLLPIDHTPHRDPDERDDISVFNFLIAYLCLHALPLLTNL